MDDLQEILDAVDMEAWCDANGIDYKRTRGRSGVQLNIKVCPVCGNSDSKVYINAETGVGNCFGGSHPPDQRFTKWNFVRAFLSDIPGRQVVEHLRAHVGARGYTRRRSSMATVSANAAWNLPESFALPHQGRNIHYLVNRGITDAVTVQFHLRYCHEGGFPYELDGQRRWMKFDQRVIIPVFDLDGKLVTFQGRDVTGTAEKKYLFPPGLPGSGAHLLNGMNVKDTKRIAIGEGAFDVMAIKLALDEDAALRDVIPIGTFGKHLSYGAGDTQEAKLLELQRRGVEEVTFMWDGEIQATDDAIDAGLRCQKLGLKVRVAMLPKDKDPNEVPGSVVRDAFYKAIPLNMTNAVRIKMQRREMNR